MVSCNVVWSETWCLRGKKLVILRRTERTMVREMYGVKLFDKWKTEDLMGMLELVEWLRRVNGVRCGMKACSEEGDCS